MTVFRGITFLAAGPQVNAVVRRRRSSGVTRNIVFHRAGLESVSPMVAVWWRKSVIDLLNQLPELAMNFGGMAEEACADFIVAFAALPPQKGISLRTEVFNLGLRWERVNQAVTAEIETRERANQWRRWLFEEIDHLTKTFFANDADRRTFPVLIDMEPPFEVTQGGVVLGRRVNRLSEPWNPGQPLWVAMERTSKARRPKRAGPPYGLSDLNKNDDSMPPV
jgi:hypothetical protein